jgi:hypothetical protein
MKLKCYDTVCMNCYAPTNVTAEMAQFYLWLCKHCESSNYVDYKRLYAAPGRDLTLFEAMQLE